MGMDPQLLNWLKENTGIQFPSPRRFVYGRNPQDITIEGVREDLEQVLISFSKRRTQALPLHFWMFDRALQYVSEQKGEAVPIGAALKPPYIEGSVEGEIWREPRPQRTPYRVSPFILDFLVLAGFAEYTSIRRSGSRKPLQGVQYKPGTPKIIAEPVPPKPPEPSNPKEEFLSKYRKTIEEWTGEHIEEIIKSRLGYRWQSKSRYECEQSRNRVSRAIIESRIRNGGAVDLDALDLVIKWGFNREYPDRDPANALRVTKKAFEHLDNGGLQRAALALMEVKNVGISRASKIIGLYDQENLCIYDSRVGYALRDLKHDGERIIMIPPSQVREGDLLVSNSVWAEQYEHLIWVAEVMRDYMNSHGCTYRLADVEMALFMMGK